VHRGTALSRRIPASRTRVLDVLTLGVLPVVATIVGGMHPLALAHTPYPNLAHAELA